MSSDRVEQISDSANEPTAFQEESAPLTHKLRSMDLLLNNE